MRLEGVLLSVKLKKTQKGNTCIAHLCESEKTKNKFWFMGWNSDYNKSTGGKEVPPEPVLCEGQKITVEVDYVIPADSVKVDEKTGRKMVFLKPNPKLVQASKPSPAMLKQAHYLEFLLANFGPKRMAKAMVSMWAHFHERIEKDDAEFFESLADASETYGSVTEKQFPHCAKLVAKYAVKIKDVENSLLAAMKEPKDEGDTLPDSYPDDENAEPADLNDEDF